MSSTDPDPRTGEFSGVQEIDYPYLLTAKDGTQIRFDNEVEAISTAGQMDGKVELRQFGGQVSQLIYPVRGDLHES